MDEPEAAVPTVMPEMLPVDTVPVEVMLLIVVLLITPEPGLLSSGAVSEPAKVPTLTLVVVPWPAAVMDEPESVLPTVMPEMLPVDTAPVEVMLLSVVLVFTPEPRLLSSGAVSEPPKVPTLTLVVVPWPAAVMDEPESVLPTVIPEMLPVDTVPVDVMLLIVVLLITPEPGLLSSGAVNELES